MSKPSPDQMEYLTAERIAKATRLSRIEWCVNMACVAVAVTGGMWFVSMLMVGDPEAPEVQLMTDLAAMMGFFIIAAILLMGAGLTRYHARVEAHHLELKLAVLRVEERVVALEKRLEGGGAASRPGGPSEGSGG